MSTEREALESAIAQQPNDKHLYQVYADWLLSHGDRWGEWIALQAAKKNVSDENDHELRDDERARLQSLPADELGSPELMQSTNDGLIKLGWFCGFVRRIWVHGDVDDFTAIDKLLRARAGRFV